MSRAVALLLAILLAALAASPAVEAAPAAPLVPEARELGCDVLIKIDGQEAKIVPAPDLHVLEQAAKDGPFKPALPSGAIAIVCRRNHIVPAEHDDEVPRLGLMLYLAEVSGARVASLELIDRSYRYRLVEGEFRPGEEDEVKQSLVVFERRPR